MEQQRSKTIYKLIKIIKEALVKEMIELDMNSLFQKKIWQSNVINSLIVIILKNKKKKKHILISKSK